MKKKLQVQILGAMLRFKLSQLSRKYSGQLVVRIWEEIIIGGKDRGFFKNCEWKSEMTLKEALEYLDDFCDFIEAIILNNQLKENELRSRQYIPAVFN